MPKPDEQAAEALIAAPMTRILDKLDMLMAAQRQLQVNQRSLQRVAPTLDASGNAAPRNCWTLPVPSMACAPIFISA